jgi:hypothetical protein
MSELAYWRTRTVIAVLSTLLITIPRIAALSPKAQPRPPKLEAAGKVTGVELRPLKTSARPVPCPAKPAFFGAITTDGPVEVTYTWITSDGKTWPNRTVKFGGKGLKSVTTDWKVGGPGKTVNDWIQLKTLAPNEKTSSRTSFVLHCAK